MIFDKKGKLFGKISIVDIIVVVIIVAVVGGLYYKFGKSGTATPFTKPDTIRISFYHEDVPNYVINSIKVGDIVRDRVQGATFGKVTDIQIGPDIFYGLAETGRTVIASSRPGYSSVTITVEGPGTYSATDAKFSGIDYYIGKAVELRAGNTLCYPKVSAIEKK